MEGAAGEQAGGIEHACGPAEQTRSSGAQLGCGVMPSANGAKHGEARGARNTPVVLRLPRLLRSVVVRSRALPHTQTLPSPKRHHLQPSRKQRGTSAATPARTLLVGCVCTGEVMSAHGLPWRATMLRPEASDFSPLLVSETRRSAMPLRLTSHCGGTCVGQWRCCCCHGCVTSP